MGVGDYYGLQNRISFSAPPGNLAPHFHVKSSARICPGGGRQADPSRSHPPSHLQHRRGVFQQYISGRQKRRRSSPCYQFKESEFLCGLPTFQNGGNPHVTGPSEKRRFYGKTGPQRRILYCPSLDRASKVLKIPLEGNSMGICMPPLRAGQCSPNIHKNHETCGGNTAEFRDSLDYISRRSSNLSRLGADCRLHLATAQNLLENLGFVINLKKSVLSPVQKIEFLVMTVDSLTLCLALPRDKVRGIRRECESLIANPTTTVRQLAHLLGRLSSSIQAVFPAPLYYRYLQQAKIQALRSGGHYESRVVLNQEAIEELQWWAENLMAWNGRALAQPDPSIIIESDASREGWGAHCNGLSTGGLWSQSEQFLHINCLELLAGSFAIKCFAKDKTNIHIQLFMDNVTALTFINKMGGGGGTKSRVLASLSRDFWQWCLQRQITVSAAHIPGILNVNADRESRYHLDSSDWKLYPAVFQALQNRWGPLDIDLFASRLTNQLPRFVSWKPDPLSEAVDAFFLQWNKVKGYAFPPFCLLGRCLSQVLRQQVPRLVLVAPVWKTQPWYPLLLDLLIDPPVLLPQISNLLTREGMTHPLTHLQLGGWLISGSSMKREAFLSKLEICSQQLGGDLRSICIRMAQVD